MAKRLGMELSFQKCRNWRHAWDDFIPETRTTHAVIYESPHQETLRCLRCETERYRGIGFTGEVESQAYDYPDGYLLDKDNKPELIVFRLSLLAELKAGLAQGNRSRAHRVQPTKKKTAHKPTPRKSAPGKRAQRATPRKRTSARARA